MSDLKFRRSAIFQKLISLPLFSFLPALCQSVAESLSCPRAYRAVGNALRHNPFAPMVPCHRVLASDGSIGGFAGGTGNCALIDKKTAMLKAEGVDAAALKKEAGYRSTVILQRIDASGLDAVLEDHQLSA
jgi:O-6-methylguanine DNA methyltransferase